MQYVSRFRISWKPGCLSSAHTSVDSAIKKNNRCHGQQQRIARIHERVTDGCGRNSTRRVSIGRPRMVVEGYTAVHRRSVPQSVGPCVSQGTRQCCFERRIDTVSCRRFVDNAMRLKFFALGYNPANFLRRMALPRRAKHWSLTTLRKKPRETGAWIVRHNRFVRPGSDAGQDPCGTRGCSARAYCAEVVGSVARRGSRPVDRAAPGSAVRTVLRCDMTAGSFSVENLLHTAPRRAQPGKTGSQEKRRNPFPDRRGGRRRHDPHEINKINQKWDK